MTVLLCGYCAVNVWDKFVLDIVLMRVSIVMHVRSQAGKGVLPVSCFTGDLDSFIRGSFHSKILRRLFKMCFSFVFRIIK